MANRRVLIELGVKVSGKAKSQLNGLSKNIKRLGKSAAKGIAIGGAAAVAGLITMTKAAANAGDEFAKMSKRTGLSVKFLSEMKHAAELSGASLSDIERATKRMSKAAFDASMGLATNVRDFNSLGVSVKNADGTLKESELLFNEVAIALGKIDNSTKKAALAQNIFGRAGTALLPILTDGKKGIEEMRKEYEAIGFQWTNKTAKDAENMNDGLLRLQTIASTIGTTIAIDLMPKITEVSDSMVSWFKNNRELINQDLSSVARDIGDAFSFVADSVSILIDAFNAISENPGIKLLMKLFNFMVENNLGSIIANAAGAAVGQTSGNIAGDKQRVRLFESDEAQARLKKIREEIHGKDAENQGASDAARDKSIAQKAVDKYATGRKKQEEKSANQNRAVLLAGA